MRRLTWFRCGPFLYNIFPFFKNFLSYSCTFIAQTASVCSARTVPETTFILFRLRTAGELGSICNAINLALGEKKEIYRNSFRRLTVSRQTLRAKWSMKRIEQKSTLNQSAQYLIPRSSYTGGASATGWNFRTTHPIFSQAPRLQIASKGFDKKSQNCEKFKRRTAKCVLAAQKESARHTNSLSR